MPASDDKNKKKPKRGGKVGPGQTSKADLAATMKQFVGFDK